MKEALATKICMKFLRKKNYQVALSALRKDSGIILEDEFLGFLYDLLILKSTEESGALAALEEYLDNVEDTIFEEYINAVCRYTAKWKLLESSLEAHNSSEERNKPSGRGGHQMCIDVENHILYLFGGWSGSGDLNDFWAFNILGKRWILLSSNCQLDGGPSPRSCHKIAFHPLRKTIYVLGKYIDTENRLNGSFSCDFYAYNVETNKWSKISEDTRSEGGPSLLYDHQMVVDISKDRLIIFGGKSVEIGTAELEYSGMYIYHISLNQSRIGHSMMIEENFNNEGSTVVYIFSGQRHKDYLGDFIAYEIESDAVIQFTKDVSKHNGPSLEFTQRASFDPMTKEIFVMCGLTREKGALSTITQQQSNPASMILTGSGMVGAANVSCSSETANNNLWNYSTTLQKWYKIQAPQRSISDTTSEPCPRYAYQFCYDFKIKKHFLFGGNPGESGKTPL